MSDLLADNAGICTLCLIGVNATMDHRFKRNTPDMAKITSQLIEVGLDWYMPATHTPREIIKWYTAVMEFSGGDARFTTGPLDDTLTAIATLGGTPVCTGHLYENLGWTGQPQRRYNPRMGKYRN